MRDKRTYRNRGMEWEGYLRFANERYKQQGIACIEKLATEFKPLRNGTGKIVSAKVESKSTVDFLGRYKHIPIAIEAKSTFENSIRFDAVQPHQADFMDAFTATPDTIGLVAVCFNLKDFFVIPWTFWKAAYDVRVRTGDRKAPVAVEAYGQTWEVPRKFSARMDELNASWKLTEEQVTYGFDYLKYVERYITQ